jgi:hypothetical protein
MLFRITAVFVLGYTIFRGTNSQKHQFKLNPNQNIWGKPPRGKKQKHTKNTKSQLNQI